MSDFLGKGFKYTNITVDKGELQIDEASIANVAEEMNRLITQQQLVMEQRMITHMMRPATFIHPVKDDGFDARVRYWSTTIKPPAYGTSCIDPDPPRAPDPLDVKHDGVTLRELLTQDRCNGQEAGPLRFRFAPAQRAAVSAHWSAELRAKVAASKERDRNEVRCDLQDEP